MSAVEEIAAQPSMVEEARARTWAVFRVEIKKLRSQIIPRFAVVMCALGPFAYIAIMKTQTTLPADTPFGRWLHTSGFALPFVLLGYAGVAGFLVLISVVAGDTFASEDRYGTWDTLLTRSCRREDVFAGKALAAATYAVLIVALLAISSLVAGVLLVGSQPLVALSGALLSPARSIGLVLASWSMCLLPVLALTSLGLLFSIATRSSVIGVLGPLVVGLLMELLSVLGFRAFMLTTPFEAGHALLISPSDLGPFVQGVGRVGRLHRRVSGLGLAAAAQARLRRVGSGRPAGESERMGPGGRGGAGRRRDAGRGEFPSESNHLGFPGSQGHNHIRAARRRQAWPDRRPCEDRRPGAPGRRLVEDRHHVRTGWAVGGEPGSSRPTGRPQSWAR